MDLVLSTMTKLKRRLVKIDNFALTMHQTCPAKYKLRIHDGWQSRRRSGALGQGSAIHAGLATWYRTGLIEDAIASIRSAWDDSTPVDDFRTLDKAIEVMKAYISVYPKESWTVVEGPASQLVEVAFTIDTEMYCDCDKCGCASQANGDCVNCHTQCEPIEYGGIFDLLAEFGNKVYVVDHKTASQMGAYYFDQFKPNNQMTGYIWAAQQLSGRVVDGCIINAICITKSGKITFNRNITTRTEREIERWLGDLRTTCNEIRYHERTGQWPMRTGSCQQYGKCEFYDVHVLSTDKEQQQRLDQDYIFSPWDYEARDEGRTLPLIPVMEANTTNETPAEGGT